MFRWFQLVSAAPHRAFAIAALVALFALCAAAAGAAGAEAIIAAHYDAPVDRYGHFALGRPHEYARLTARTDSGREFSLQLPDDEVFEDLEPRLVRLAADDPQGILAIVSQREKGSRLVMIGLRAKRLEITAQSAAIGTPMRWLNPVGVADLDGDGRAEIAAVITPHVGGRLKVFRREGSDLLEIAALDGFSNHVYGSPELALSTVVSIAGRMYLLVPDTTRRQLRIVGMNGEQLLDAGRCPLAAPLTGAVELVSESAVSVGLLTGRQLLIVDDCRKGTYEIRP